jgi:glycosyltransferase involved in cell wall biosynthesis
MNMSQEILVSIVLPMQGTENALDRCMRSVLRQSETRWQLLLAVSDGTRAWAEAWAQQDERIQVLPDEVSGRAAALRAGLAVCRGTFTVFLDVEHVWASDFLELTTAFLNSNLLEDMVCMEVHTETGQPAVPVYPARYQERGQLSSVQDGGAVWHRDEMARHLRWGEYTRLAVTLLRTEYAGLLIPALREESAALDYRLQAHLAAKCAVNFLALPGALHHPAPASVEQLRQWETDALAVFDEIHCRQWETDRELARLRRERIARIGQRTPLQALAVRCRAFLQRAQPQSRSMAADLAVQKTRFHGC